MFLNDREQGYKDAGIYHFDPYADTNDMPQIGTSLDADICDFIYQHISKRFTDFIPQMTRNSMQRILKTDISGEEERLDILEYQTQLDYSIVMNKEDPGFYMLQMKSTDEIYDTIKQKVEQQYSIRLNDRAKNSLGYSSAIGFAWQEPGQTTVNHIDNYLTDYDKRSSRYQDPGHRKLICFLEDWQPGQFFMMGNKVSQKWQKGQAVVLKWGMPHSTANLSNRVRITMMLKVMADENPNLPS
jgi:hypothetical protein